MERRISVSDVTMKLTDGKEETALSFRKKIELSKRLDKLGLSVIEASPIVNGKKDSLLVKSLASAIRNSILAVPVDVFRDDSVEETWSALKEAVHPRLQVCLPVSTVQMEYQCHRKPAVILQTVAALTARCKKFCEDVEFVAVDFGRSDAAFLSEAVKAAVDGGATVVTMHDTAGNLLPDEFYQSIRIVRDSLPKTVRLGVWCSDDMYMSTSNAISAIRAGADEVKTIAYDNDTASLKRFVSIVKAKADVLKVVCDVNDTEVRRAVAQIKMLCKPEKSKSLAYLDGLHEDEDAAKLTIHDDKEAVMKAVRTLGYDLSDEDEAKVFEAFVMLASKNEVIESKELDAIVASVAFQAPPTYKLESYVINSGNTISATCHIRLVKEGNLLESVCVGDGPVDAAFLAIEKVVDKHYELDDFQIRSVTEGREAMGEAVVRLRYNGKVYSGRGISTDIVGSSIMAYLNAVNKIFYEEDEA